MKQQPFQVIFTGGRDYSRPAVVFTIINYLGVDQAIVGDCPTGLDKYVRTLCKYSVYYADWDKYGLAAGPVRNRKMLEENKGCLVIAFPGGKGTKNCVKTALKLGMTVLQVLE